MKFIVFGPHMQLIGRFATRRRGVARLTKTNSGGTRMDQLWAPWRLAYVATAKPPTDADPCFICQGLAAEDDRRFLIAHRTPRSVVVLNRYPYNNGHLLVAPRAHKGLLDDLDAEEL